MAKKKKMPKALKAYLNSIKKKKKKSKKKKTCKRGSGKRGSGKKGRKGGKKKFRPSFGRKRMTYAQRARAYLQMGRFG